MMEPDTAIEDILRATFGNHPAEHDSDIEEFREDAAKAVILINALITERVVAELEKILEAPGRTAYTAEDAAEKRIAELKGEKSNV